MAVERQTATLPPAQPSYILRGHVAQIHSVRFVRQNTRLLTGDADGWIVYWKVETKRALAVWKAHEGAILGTSEWGRDKIITHGRDNNLRIWQVRHGDEAILSTSLPAEQASADQPKPWLLHTLPVNTLNFCAFSMCHKHTPKQLAKIKHSTTSSPPSESVLIAVPARDDKKVEVYQFPEERLRFVVPRAQTTDTGMVMAVKLVHQTSSNNILVLVGYEGGLTAAFRLPPTNDSPVVEVAELVYLSQPHTQPILSIDASPAGDTYFTSSADAIIAAHRAPDLTPYEEAYAEEPSTTVTADDTKSAPNPPSEPHHNRTDPSHPPSSPPNPQTQSPFPSPEPINFSKKLLPNPSSTSQSPPTTAGLSSLLSSNPSLPKSTQPPPPTPIPILPAYKITNTKHSGQQSLRVRSDGRLLVTGGWDSRIRIYSAKTLREVAVLKWHKEGVYAVGFSEVLGGGEVGGTEGVGGVGEDVGGDVGVVRETGLSRLQRQREEAMQSKHWVVAGAKDGKVSLWEVF
ncbi:WD40 repeat-like protein [Plenodomus tracheiphilus IPT5]|uniref:ASTRA-associated protein 1 n=1 Tax=Plenodomus tracheiphilus IPT5 TaxID=1408161 RepID=A0A6A7BKL0_9PLEO|nr:WD40 repeat-like protein [Plenodomus tracheiphilus IPT5]